MQVEWVDANDEFPRLHWVLDEGALAAFSAFGLVHYVHEGEVIFERDEPSFALYLVLEGGVTISSAQGAHAAGGPDLGRALLPGAGGVPRRVSAHDDLEALKTGVCCKTLLSHVE